MLNEFLRVLYVCSFNGVSYTSAMDPCQFAVATPLYPPINTEYVDVIAPLIVCDCGQFDACVSLYNIGIDPDDGMTNVV